MTRCPVRYGLHRCGNPLDGTVPVCAACLEVILGESDPARRRTLASIDLLPSWVVTQLSTDADEWVRVEVATRSDLPDAVAAILCDPTREPSPNVWRAVARTPAGARHATSLLEAPDGVTAALVATNPDLDDATLRLLTDSPIETVATAAISAASGLSLDPALAAQARSGSPPSARSLSSSPRGTTRPTKHAAQHAPIPVPSTGEAPVVPAAAPSPPPVLTVQPAPLPPPPPPVLRGPSDTSLRDVPEEPVIAVAPVVDPGPSESSENDRRPGLASATRTLRGLVGVAAAACLVILIAVGAGMWWPSTTRLPEVSPTSVQTPTTTHAPTPTQAPLPSTTSTTLTPTTTDPPTTVVPTPPPPTSPPTPEWPAPPVTAAPQPAPAPAPVPPPPSGPTTRSITLSSRSGNYCGSTNVTVTYSPSPATVTIRDAAGRTVGSWSGPSGQTRSVALPQPTRTLTVIVSSDAGRLSVAASAAGPSC